MRLGVTWWWVAWLLTLAEAKKIANSINRQHQGDMFTTKDVPCSSEVCVGRSSGTAAMLPQPASSLCSCQCLQHLPVFRDDLHICVDDIHECPLASFQSGTTQQKIPFVFLPLRGQIVYPSAEISFPGSLSPICVVSGSQFLTSHGWADLRSRNGTQSEPPFRLYRDEGRTFLQWLGDSELRLHMEGRLLMVHLMCKDLENSTNIFMPCVAFRVAGSPRKNLWVGVREVSFSADAHAGTNNTNPTEYAAIAVCSVLLGLVYVSSVLLYLHLRKRKREALTPLQGDESGPPPGAGGEEGVIKNNPLLRHCHDNSGYVSDDDCCSGVNDDDDDNIEALPDDEPGTPPPTNIQVTCAMVHPCTHEMFSYENSVLPDIHQDSSAIERLPEENVSIVETPEGREDRPETVRAIAAANTRRKLYFNPAFFDLELLLAPPPAALEFLTKIREVIAIAKHKMASKKFLPSLLGIPEECDGVTAGRGCGSVASGSVSVVTVRQNPGRRRSCEGCPGCSRPPPCQSCCPENKHSSIRKWLEDVRPPTVPESVAPVIKEVVHKPTKHGSTKGRAPDIPKQVQKKPVELIDKTKSNKTQLIKNTVEEINKINDDLNKILESQSLKTSSVTGKVIGSENKNNVKKSDQYASVEPKEAWNDILFKSSISDANEDGMKVPSPPPPSVCSSIHRGSNRISHTEPTDEPVVPQVARHLMDAVIKEFVDQRSLEPKPSPPIRSDSLPSQKEGPTSIEYDTDSLDRTLTRQSEGRECEGMRTPSDYGGLEVRNNNVSNLPMEEELTMRNSVFNKKTGNTTISKLKNDIDQKRETSDDHDYEVILLNPDNNKLNLPDILSRVEGYSLVSEVYVNDGYSFGSASSIRSNESSCASLPNETTEPKIKYDEPGHLTIEVEDSPRNYERTYDSDSFEPDTLDRKPSKFKINSEGQFEYQYNKDSYVDSLERPTQISLKTTGSFRSDSSVCWYDTSNFPNMVGSPLNRTFGSLREIFEAKNRYHRNGNVRSETLSPVGSTRSLDTDCYSTMSLKRGKPKLLRPEAKQAKRQRPPSPKEYIPPRPPKAIYTNEHFSSKNGVGFGDDSPPLPPRNNKPPLPPKNGQVRSISQRVAAFNQLSAVSHLSSATRGVLTHASGHSPTSSDYEAVETQSKNLGRRLEMSLQTELQRKFEAAHERRITSRTKNQRDKRHVNFIRKTQRVSKVPHRTEDSGYLSSDSDCQKRNESLSETDDSLCDGASESGGESIATDSFFFGKSHKLSVAESVDSGVGEGLGGGGGGLGVASVHSDSDSNVSFVTVLPTDLLRTNVMLRPTVK
ncbi:uncharacterized protein LOC129005720 [Macrosteles quadrilineatus]|uniref:uncharacterized protein LOC129005720 n=1 Tax=Macrosteles quadrilineatus TaxID=74068 RepID=UPI0023E0A004|nr:uncharacterized protein LOC129005720 [Macrosteles quadrilineatus]